MLAYLTTFGRGAFAPAGNSDFNAFYCAGVTANAGADPYRMEPLRTCENRVASSSRKHRLFAMPAPLPAYDLGVFRVVAKLPFAIAMWSWLVLLCVVCTCAMLAVIRLGSFPPLLVVAGMLFPLLVSVYFGQIAPFSVLGIVILARAFRKTSLSGACFGALLAATEPHLGAFAVCASLVWGAPRVRVGVLFSGAMLVAASVVSLPVAETVEYVRAVLPLHALSEINFQNQYGLPYALHQFGVEENIAVHISELAFVCSLILGVANVPRLRRSLSPELAILAPSAALLLVAPFLHVTQVAIAEPAALLLWRKTGRRADACSALLLAVPWIQYSLVYVYAPLVASAFALLGHRLLKMRPTYGLAIGALAVGLCTQAGYDLVDAPTHALLTTNALATSLAETSWREFVDLNGSPLPFIALYAKLPTYIGLLIVALSVIRAARVARSSPSSAFGASSKTAALRAAISTRSRADVNK